MDPLSVTASVLAIATFAWQSCKAAYELIDGLSEAPETITKCKTSLIETQRALEGLHETLTLNDSTGALQSVLQTIKLDGALRSAQSLCDDFAKIIKKLTYHSADGKLRMRNRVMIHLQESKIQKLNKELGDCQRTISLVLASINLYVP